MAGTTANYNFPLLDHAQLDPEVPLNEMMELADAAIADAVSYLTVKEVGDSPAGDAFNVREMQFVNATVEEQSNGVALVTMEPTSSGLASIEVTDGITDLTGITKLTFSGAVSAAAGATGEAAVTVGETEAAGYPGTVDDLVYWFEADLPKVSSGNPIFTLPNSTPWNAGLWAVLSNLSATRSATPLNSLGVVTFNGSTAYYTLSGGIVLHEATIFFVAKPGSVSANETFINGTSTGCLGYYLNTSGHPSLVVTGAAVVGAASTALTINTWAQGNATYDSSSGAYAFRLNRATDGSGTSAHSVTAPSLGIGADNSGASPFSGDWAELIVFNRVLTSTEITNVENYLHSKWGV